MRKTNWLTRFLIVMVILTLAISFLPQGGAYAALPVLSISPASGTFYDCDGYIYVNVADVVNLNAYDILLQFTSSIPGAIEILEVTNGSFLDFGAWVIPVSIDNTNLRIRAQMTQVNPSTPKTGGGDLLRIRIRTIIPGATVGVHIINANDIPVPTVPTKLSAIGGVPIDFTPVDGSFTTSGECPFTTHAYIDPFSQCITDVPSAFTLTVKVRYAVDLVGYSLKLSFNPGSIFITSVTNGDFLPQGLVEPTNSYNNTTGSINYGVTWSNPAVPQTGSGTLITISGIILDADPAIVNFNILDTSRLIYWYYNPEIPNDPGSPADVIFTNTDGSLTLGSCNPNAVDLLSFDGLRKPNKAILSWETASELNNVGFNIYRSGFVDGVLKLRNKEPIPAQMVGTNMGASYQFIDKPLKPWKTYYYWLEWVDLDGKTVLSDPIKVKPPKN